jgi:hypothetical protein
MIHITRDNAFLLLKVSEITGIDKTFNMYREFVSIKAVSLQTGAILDLAKVKTSLGIDWCDN